MYKRSSVYLYSVGRAAGVVPAAGSGAIEQARGEAHGWRGREVRAPQQALSVWFMAEGGRFDFRNVLVLSGATGHVTGVGHTLLSSASQWSREIIVGSVRV